MQLPNLDYLLPLSFFIFSSFFLFLLLGYVVVVFPLVLPYPDIFYQSNRYYNHIPKKRGEKRSGREMRGVREGEKGQ